MGRPYEYNNGVTGGVGGFSAFFRPAQQYCYI